MIMKDYNRPLSFSQKIGYGVGDAGNGTGFFKGWQIVHRDHFMGRIRRSRQLQKG